MPIQSCGQSVSAPRGKACARLNAHTELRAKRQRSAREVIYRNRPIGRPWAKARFKATSEAAGSSKSQPAKRTDLTRAFCEEAEKQTRRKLTNTSVDVMLKAGRDA